MLDMENPGAGSTAHGVKNANCLTAKPDAKYTADSYFDQAVDLWSELRIARANQQAVEILARHDVTDPNARQLCGLARIVKMGRFFEFHPDGEYHVIVPVIDVDELVDLLAFDPDEPGKWWCRIGGERLLDGDALGDQHLGKPLHIYRTPLSWLKGRCDGIVIFNIAKQPLSI